MMCDEDTERALQSLTLDAFIDFILNARYRDSDAMRITAQSEDHDPDVSAQGREST